MIDRRCRQSIKRVLFYFSKKVYTKGSQQILDGALSIGVLFDDASRLSAKGKCKVV